MQPRPRSFGTATVVGGRRGRQLHVCGLRPVAALSDHNSLDRPCGSLRRLTHRARQHTIHARWRARAHHCWCAGCRCRCRCCCWLLARVAATGGAHGTARRERRWRRRRQLSGCASVAGERLDDLQGCAIRAASSSSSSGITSIVLAHPSCCS